MSQYKLIKAVMVVAVIHAAILVPQSSYAQLRARRGSDFNFAPQLGVGQTTVSYNSILARSGGLSRGSRSAPSVGNYLRNASMTGSSFGGRAAPATSVLAAGTTMLGNYQRGSQMISYFGYSPSARRLGITGIPTGRGYAQRPITPVFADNEVRQFVGASYSVVANVSLERQILLSKSSGAEHDDPSVPAVSHLQNVDGESGHRVSYGEALSARLEVRRECYLNQAWRMLREGDFIRGRSAFEIATMLDGQQLTPRVGEFLVDIVEGRFLTAATQLKIILEQSDNPFDAYYPLSSVLPETSDPSLADVAMANVVARADVISEDSAPLAIHAYLLWLNGEREMALAVAERIHRDYRDSTYATMADQMQEYMESGEEVGAAYSR